VLQDPEGDQAKSVKIVLIHAEVVAYQEVQVSGVGPGQGRSREPGQEELLTMRPPDDRLERQRIGTAEREISSRARIRVPGLEADVAVEDVGRGTALLRTGIDAAYRTKYGSSSSTASIVTPEAAATTLQLSPEE
jgi:Uncharacterized protein conserved in bacteria (DUF2255)